MNKNENNRQDKKLSYLTAMLPSYIKIGKQVSSILNKKGLKTSRGRDYTASSVLQVTNGRYDDPNIKEVLIDLIAEHQRKEAEILKKCSK